MDLIIRMLRDWSSTVCRRCAAAKRSSPGLLLEPRCRKVLADWYLRILPIGVDDTLVFFALALELATMVLTILGGLYGSGKHVWALNMNHLKMIFKVLYGYTFVYGAAAAAVKLSFVFFFARLFDTGLQSDTSDSETIFGSLSELAPF